MGMIQIDLWGSFPKRQFKTCAQEGGHVAALKRGIEFLAAQLGEAVVKDAKLTAEGIVPPVSPLGVDKARLEGR